MLRNVSVKNPAFMLAVALLVCFISAFGASLIKSGGGSISVKQLKWETPSGHMQAAQLFIPKNATGKNPAPAIVVTHGWSNTNEMQAPNYIEFSRRGYVVLAIDMYGHGDSDNVPIDSWWNDNNGGNGVYDGVKLLATLPYIDASQIGITGHSNGAYASNIAVLLDNETAKPLISSVLLAANDAYYSNTPYYMAYYDGSDKQYTNRYGNRNVGLIAAKHDEIFHRIKYMDGTLTTPNDFIDQPTAQSFLNFGRNPTGLEKRDSYRMYTENIDGKDAIRVIYNPDMVHPWGILSSRLASYGVEFFQKAIPAPNPIASTNQIWQWKVFFETIGIIGFFMFFVNFIAVMLKTRFFGVLNARKPTLPSEATRRGKVWLWVGLSVNAIFAAISYPVIFIVGNLYQPTFFNQQQPWVLALWSLFCGLFTLFVLFLNYRGYAKANGLNLREQGVILSKDKLLKTVLLGVLAAASTYSIVFLTTYFFKTDFRIWFIFTFRAFDAIKFAEILKFLPFFLIFYVANSIAMNAFNFIKIGKKEWINTLLMAIFNTSGPIFVLVIFYSYFFATGLMPTDYLACGVGSMCFWIYAIVVILPLVTVLSRIIYKHTRNPYLPGIAFSIIIVTMLCTNALTYLI
jgi:pimeloyl-ACP methyl ester carboxylesterase